MPGPGGDGRPRGFRHNGHRECCCAAEDRGDPGPMADIIQHAADLAAKQGVPVKVIIFSDWITPNVAVADGDVDANFYQHKPYLAVANKTQHFSLVAVAPGLIMPMGLFSHKLKNLAAYPGRRPSRGRQRSDQSRAWP